MRYLLVLLLFFCTAVYGVDSEHSYITGNKFKDLCRYSLDEYGYKVNKKVNNNYWFVKTDLLDQFFNQYLPLEPFILVSHNSDYGVTENYLPLLDLPQLIHWYAQNVEIFHPKLSSIPIGLGNAIDHRIVEVVQDMNLKKNALVYANYTLWTNPTERKKCLMETGVPRAKLKPFQEFLEDVAQSYFVISPDGNGIDTHRTWEALYLRAIPIITKNNNSVFYADLPIIILNSWEDYKNLKLTKELYHTIWGDFDPASLRVDHFIQ